MFCLTHITPPIECSPTHRLCIRPLVPQGCTIEYEDGTVLCAISERLERLTFRLVPSASNSQGYTLEVEAAWIEP